MVKSTFISAMLLAVCVASGKLQASLVISFNPTIAPTLGANFTDFDVIVTNNAASTDVNAMKFSVQLSGAGATFSIFDAPATYRSTNQYVFNAPGDNFGVATTSQFLALSGGDTVATFNDTAIVPVVIGSTKNNFRTMATNESLLVGKLRVNYSAPIAAPYSFQLAASSLSGVGNELGGTTYGTYSGFGFGSGTITTKTMSAVPFAAGSGFSFSVTAVPEPSTFGLVGIALTSIVGRALLSRRRKSLNTQA